MPLPGQFAVIEPGVTDFLHEDLSRAIGSAPQLDGRVCVHRAAVFSRQRAIAPFLAGPAPIPPPLRARLAASRSSVIIAGIAVRRHTSQAGDMH